MFFVRFSGLLKPKNTRIVISRFCQKPVCPHVDAGTKRQFAEPGCKKLIIIGGTGAVGQATATQMLCNKAKRVALIDTDICKGKDAVDSLNCTFGKDRALFFKSDVTNKCDIHDHLKKVKGELKEVDIIVNAFGVWDETKWEQQITLNLMGTINVNQIAKEILKPGGFVLNITGVPGTEVFPASPGLAASFMGVVAYTQAVGHEKNALTSKLRTAALCCGITESNFSKDADKRTPCPQMANELRKYFNDTCWQKPDVVGKAAVEMYKYAAPGTIWIIEGSRLFYLALPDLNSKFRALENQFI